MKSADDPRVDLWRIFVPQQLSEVETHWHRLDAVERQRAAGFHRESDRQRYVISQGSLRRLLGQRLGIDPACVAFDRGEFGKPRLATQPGPHFNSSHSGDWVVHGFSNSTPLGVDVEAIPADAIELDDFRHVLANQELQRLGSLSPELRNEAFISTWVRKEASVKATGHGLSKPLGDICVEAFDECRCGLADDQLATRCEDWNWLMLDFGPGYAGCLTYPGPPLVVHIQDLL